MSTQPAAHFDPPFRIQAPTPAYFDGVREVWVLSRYPDVVAAFRETQLWPVGVRGQDQSVDRDDTGKLTFRADLQHALSPSRMAVWQSQVEDLARATLDQLPVGRPVDLLREFAEPVGLALAMGMMGACPADRERLSGLGTQVFGRVGSPKESLLRPQADAAVAELARFFQNVPIPRSEQTFMGVSKTLPRLLANGWVALLRHPPEIKRLRLEPRLMPRAVEELMRYAPTVHVIARRAKADVDLDGLRIARGQQVNLMLASANRDPVQFPDPDRLDVSRRPASQAALGIGRDSCAGAVVVRMVSAITTAALLESFPKISLIDPVEWHSGLESCWPESVRVVFQRRADC
jgi:cytochrome P450